MHPQLVRALDPVLRDLRAGGLPVDRIAASDWPGDDGVAGAMLWRADGTGAGVSVVLDRPIAEQVAHVADMVHDWAIDGLWGTERTDWPPCPDHPGTHPLRVERSGSEVRWSCPRTGRGVCRVGELR
ncbi:hypothetical protein [Blastococcus sp. SYSU DS0619]